MSEKLTDLINWNPSAVDSLESLLKQMRASITNEAKRICLETNKSTIDSEMIYQAMKKLVKAEFYDPYANSGPRGD